MPEVAPCPECGVVHLSKAGNPKSHAQWVWDEKRNAPGGVVDGKRGPKKPVLVTAEEVEKGPDDGVRQDFAQEVMDVYGRLKRGMKGPGPLDKYAHKAPDKFLEKFVLTMAARQVVPEDPDADRKREQRMVEEDVTKLQKAYEGFMEEWGQVAR